MTTKLTQDSGRKQQATKKSGLEHSVTIDARFGSDMQRTVAIRLLDQFLAAWKEEAESRHKENSITIIQGNIGLTSIVPLRAEKADSHK